MQKLSKNLQNKTQNIRNKVNYKNYFSGIVVFFVRFLKFAPNFSPLGSFGFFSRSAVPFLVIIVAFDLIFGGFYKGFLWTYLGFASYYILGKLARNNFKLQLILLPVASVSFFIFSNLGVYLNWYPQGTSYFVACFINALPFFKMTLLSDLIFGYGYLILKKLIENRSYFKINFLIKTC